MKNQFNKKWLLLSVSLFFSLQLKAQIEEELPCDDPSVCGDHPKFKKNSSLKLISGVAKKYQEALIISPEKFTRNGAKIKQGAVYSEDGHVVCILKNNEGAYLYQGERFPDLEKKREEERIKQRVSGSVRPSVGLCQEMADKSTKLSISNGDFLNRLHWSVAEGNCGTVLSIKDKGAKQDFPALRTPIYYQGFVLNNLREKFKSEEHMLRSSANSGPGHDYYPIYFVRGGGADEAQKSFRLILKPFSWNHSTRQEAFDSGELSKRMPYCLSDLLASVVPEGKSSDPTAGRFQWGHNTRGCRGSNLQVHYHYGGLQVWKRDIYSCFHKGEN